MTGGLCLTRTEIFGSLGDRQRYSNTGFIIMDGIPTETIDASTKNYWHSHQQQFQNIDPCCKLQMGQDDVSKPVNSTNDVTRQNREEYVSCFIQAVVSGGPIKVEKVIL